MYIVENTHESIHSSSLKFNAVSDWWDEYIAYVAILLHSAKISSLFSYDSLKKCIYQLEKQQQGHEQLLTYDPESNERSTLLAEQDVISTDAMFIPLLDRELRKIATFYEHQENELINDLEELEKSLLEQEDVGLGRRYYDLTDEDDEDDSLDESLSPERRRQPSNHQPRRSGSGRRGSACVYLPYVAH